MSAYGPKADHLGASATGPNMAVFEQDKSASPESAQAEWDARLCRANKAQDITLNGEFCDLIHGVLRRPANVFFWPLASFAPMQHYV